MRFRKANENDCKLIFWLGKPKGSEIKLNWQQGNKMGWSQKNGFKKSLIQRKVKYSFLREKKPIGQIKIRIEKRVNTS